MAVKNLRNTVNQPVVIKPTLVTGPSVTESDVYELDIEKATYNTDTDILVLLGTPTRYTEDGNTEVYKKTPVCVNAKYSEDTDVNPILDLFDVFGLDINKGIPVDFFKGKKVKVYIDVSVNYRTGRTYWNAEEFGI